MSIDFEALKSKIYYIYQLFWTLVVPENVAIDIFYQNLPNHGQEKQKSWVY